ncbi:Sugar transport protein 8 [Camellia lanceoleosa]|uniref:Sugar transport protein 8 n=1 Tax=Camellia lanceoleosa TaxID=1840588 RepID=A0ACC0GLK0_9ERIC|nr:Sugar transport protein 8 [Camellia lanceoleosa]
MRIFKSKITVYVVACWIVAAFGGLMFGYDIGISGGVTAMDDFLIKFFPKVHKRKLHAKEDNYCKYDDQLLQLFTSSLYLAALVASFGASKACRIFGRKPTILVASLFFIGGAGFSALAEHKWMLILAVPVFLSEIAPVQHRGAVNILFQLFVTIGILIAGVVNYFTSTLHPIGWRVSLAIAGIPGLVLFFGSMILTETPASLIERGKDTKGKAALKKIRGVDNVDDEYEEVKRACEIAKEVKQPFKKLMKRSSVPPLVIGIMLQIFQQMTGINAIMFYAPVLFQTMGFKNDASLLSAVITGTVNVASTFVSIYLVDKIGRRKLLLQACVQMFICQVSIGAILLTHLNTTGTMDKGLAMVVVVLVCLYVMCFAWSWGPLGWLIPSETFPLETRTSGFAFAVSSNMLMTFLVAQAFLSMLCHMRAFIFFFLLGLDFGHGIVCGVLVPKTECSDQFHCGKGVEARSCGRSSWMMTVQRARDVGFARGITLESHYCGCGMVHLETEVRRSGDQQQHFGGNIWCVLSIALVLLLPRPVLHFYFQIKFYGGLYLGDFIGCCKSIMHSSYECRSDVGRMMNVAVWCRGRGERRFVGGVAHMSAALMLHDANSQEIFLNELLFSFKERKDMAMKKMMGESVCVLGLVMVVLAAIASSMTVNAAITCQEAITKMLPCQQYLVGNSGITVPCCNQMAASITDHQTVCRCFKQVGPSLVVQVDKAKQLPSLCEIDIHGIPIDYTVDCKFDRWHIGICEQGCTMR